jgi:alpha-N-arabinofuranosidase
LTGQEGIFGSSTLELAGKELIIKLVNTSDKSQAQSISVESTRKLSPKGKLTVLKGNDLNGMNSLVSPQHISPVEQELVVKGRKISVVLSPYSMNVIRVKLM